ncbi:general odorant-binding protein 69a-like isoform X2 [Diabrotica undecimpunctata]
MAVLTEKQQQNMDSIHTMCVSEIGVSEDVIDKAKSGDFVQDPKLKCYMKCYFDKIGVIGDDGKIDVDYALATLPDNLQYCAPVIKKCGSQAGADICDVVFNTMKCQYNEDKTAFFLP